jgi:hypothetical protein
MLIGFKIRDFALLTNLAYSTMQNARKACSAYLALAREVNSLHAVLTRLKGEVTRPESLFYSRGNSEASSGTKGNRDVKSKELVDMVKDCKRLLKLLKKILEKVYCIRLRYLRIKM